MSSAIQSWNDPALVSFLNHRIKVAKVDKQGWTTFHVDAGGSIRLVPDKPGVEANVVSTTNGVSPVH